MSCNLRCVSLDFSFEVEYFVNFVGHFLVFLKGEEIIENLCLVNFVNLVRGNIIW